MYKAENQETRSRGVYLFRKKNKHITACGQLVSRIVFGKIMHVAIETTKGPSGLLFQLLMNSERLGWAD